MLKYKNLIIIGVCIIILIIGISYAILDNNYSNDTYNFDDIKQDNMQESNIISDEPINQKKNIMIHITGQVNFPGIINLEEGSRIIDAIESAGGLTESADLSSVNLAYELQDAQKIYIPSVNDLNEINVIQENGSNVLLDDISKKLKININKATESELQNLDGIGLSTARKIVQYRNENGDFKKIEDLKNVPGIGDSKFSNIKDQICTK